MSDTSRVLALWGLLIVLAACGGGAKTVSPPAAGGSGESPTQPAARIGERVITLGEVDSKARAASMAPYQALYDARRQALDTLIAETLMDAEAKSRGLAREALIQQEVTAKVANPTDAEIEKVYKENANAMGGRSLEQVKPQIQNYLATQSRNQAIQRFLNDLRKKAAVEITLDAPRVAVTIAENDPTRGPAGAPVQILEFSDFQCPYCAKAVESIKKVEETYGDKVQVVWRDFPLSFHNRAHVAAEAAQCANAQGKFWEYHDKLFENQSALQDADLKSYAAAVGLDTAAFEQCLSTGRFRNDVNRDLEEGSHFGVSGTPAFFVNGRFLNGAQPYEAFAQVIDDELKRKGITR